MTYRNLFTNFAKSLRCQALESKTFHDVNRKTWGSKNLQIITPKKYLGIHKRKNFGDGAIIHNVLQLGEVAEIEGQMLGLAQKFNRITAVEFSTKPAILPNCC